MLDGTAGRLEGHRINSRVRDKRKRMSQADVVLPKALVLSTPS